MEGQAIRQGKEEKQRKEKTQERLAKHSYTQNKKPREKQRGESGGAPAKPA